MMLGTPPTSHSFKSQRLKLHYADWGNPAAPPMVLLHGGRDHCRNWDWVADRLRADWHVMAPDLRGHGDSAWSPDGDYSLASYVCDFTQFVHQIERGPVTIVAHSLGGNIALRYSGLYPDSVHRVVAIEGLGASPQKLEELDRQGFEARWREWIRERRSISARAPRRYATLAEALARMRSENNYLTEAQAEHLTLHAVSRNEDGTWSWKFDNYVHVFSPMDLSTEQLHVLWGNITCPTLLCYGANSWATNPAKDGQMQYFRNARLATFANAGHWLHHDQLDAFMLELQIFLRQ